MTVTIKSGYEPVEPVRIHFTEPSLAKQSMAKECDINNIMKKYDKTGLLDHVSKYEGRYEDLPGDIDFQTAQNTVIAANQAFDSLPSKIRNRFENNPGLFLDFVQDPGNKDECISMGLMKPLSQAPETPADNPPGVGAGDDPPVQPAPPAAE